VSAEVDGSLPIPRHERFAAAGGLTAPTGWCVPRETHSETKRELRAVIAEAFDVPEALLGGCPPPPETTPQEGWSGVTSKLIHDALNEAMMRNIAVEQEVATTAIKLGVGYARIETWSDTGYRTDDVITSLVPPLERFEFPNWSSFEVWRGQQEARRG
jgi:hypothetical protein